MYLDRMVCNILFITVLSFLCTAEQMEGKKSAKRVMFLIFLSLCNAEYSAVFTMLGIPKSIDIKSS